MAVKFSNNARTNLSSAILSTATSITVDDASVFPTLGASDHTFVTFESLDVSPTREIVKVTAIDTGTDTLTVVRGQDGTTAAAFSSGAKVELRMTAALLNAVVDDTDTESVSKTGDTMTGNLEIHNGSPILELKDTTDNDDHHIYFKDQADNVVYEIASQNATSGDALTFYSSSQEIVHRIGSTNRFEVHANVIKSLSQFEVTGNIIMTGDQLRVISSTDSNLGWMLRDNTYTTDEMDITATRLSSGNTPTLGLAGQSGINFYVGGSNVGSFNSSGNLTGLGTISSGAITSSGSSLFTSNSGDPTVWLYSTRPTLAFTDTNSFSDDDDQYIIRAGSNNLQFQWYDASIPNTYTNLTLSSNGDATFAGTISSGAITATGLQIDHSTHSGVDFNFTDSNSNSHFYGMHIDHNISGSDALDADYTKAAIYVDMDNSSSAGTTSNELRMTGIYSDVRTSGDSDVVRGYFGHAESNHSDGTIGTVAGGWFQGTADHSGSASTTNIYGVYGIGASGGDGTGSTSNVYGLYGKSVTQTVTYQDTSQLVGVYAEAEIADPGASNQTTIGSVFGINSQIDYNGAGNVTVNNGYLFYGNYAGTQPTNAYGVYIADDVRSRFGGAVEAKDGSASTPSHTFYNDRDTGMYRVTTNELGFSTAGTNALTLDATQNATFAGNITANGSSHTFYSSQSNNTLSFGRNANEKLVTTVGDSNIELSAHQDSDSNGNHSFILDRHFAGSGANDFKIQKAGSNQFTIDTNGDADLFGNLAMSNSGVGNNITIERSDTSTSAIWHVGGSQSYIGSTADIPFNIWQNGAQAIGIDDGDTTFAGSVTAPSLTVNGTISIATAAVPFTFNETGHTGTGQYWRMPIDGGNLRFDVDTTSTNGDGTFTSYSEVFRLYADGNANLNGTFTSTSGSITSKSTSGGFFYAEDSNTGLANDSLVGGFLFKNNDTSGTEPHYAGMTARTSNQYGSMSLEFFADRADYEGDTPAMVLYADSADSTANTLNLQSSTAISNATDITATGHITADKARIGEWAAANSYHGLFHDNQTGNEYMIISADTHTFISATTGNQVRIRGGNNVSTYEIRVYDDQDPTASGNKIYHAGDFGTPLELTGGTLTGNLSGTNVIASGYMQATGGFYNNASVANNDAPIDTISIASGGSGFTDGVYANVVVAGGSYGRMRVTVSGGTVTGVEKASGGFHYNDATGVDQSANLNAKGAGSGSGFTTNHTVKESLIHLYGNPGIIRFTQADASSAANQEIGSIRFAARDASTDGGGDVAQIVAKTRSTSGGGYLDFLTSYNGGEVYSDTAERLTLRLYDGIVYIGKDAQIALRDSTDRSGLLENAEVGSFSYSGFQITRNTNDQHWSYMASDTLVGLYDDTNGDWAYQYDENGGFRIYYNNSVRIETLSDGIDVHGGDAAQLRQDSATFARGYAAFDYYTSTGAVTNTAGRLKLFSNAKTGWEPDQDLGAIEWYSNDTSGIGPRTAAKIIVFNDSGNGSTTTAVSGSMAFYTSAYNTAQVEALRLDTAQNAILENGHIRIGPDSGDGFNGNAFLRMQQAGTSHYMQMKSDTDRDVGLLFGDTADDFEGGFIYSNTNDALSFYANNALSFTIDSARDVIFAQDIETDKVRLSSDTEHYIAFSTTSPISGATADTTRINGRQIDLYAYDDIYLRAGSADSIYLWSGGDATLTLDSTNEATFVGNVTISGNVLDFDLNTTSDNRGIEFDGRDALTADTADGWLRLNNSSEFSNGVYTPGLVRIDGTLDVGEYIRHQNDTNTYIRFVGDDLRLYAGGRQMIRMDEGTNPDKLEFVVSTTYTDSDGHIVASGNITAYASDRRLKTNIKPIENALSKIMSIRGVTYDWRDEVEELGFHPDRKTDCMGVIAQELEEAGVEQVIKPAPFDQYRSAETNWKHVSKSGENYKTVDYDKLTALCIQGIREQQEIINAQQEQINQLIQALEDIKNGDD